MLEVTVPAVETQFDVDFADIYQNSSLYHYIVLLSTWSQIQHKDLYFPTKYSQPFPVQCKACFWKMHWSYWRNPQYNAIRFFTTIVIGERNFSCNRAQQQDLMNLLGAMYAAVLFLGTTNASVVRFVVAIERTVFYRERAAGMYSELPYAFAQVAIETVYVAIQTFIYTLLLFSMIGFKWKVEKFIWFCFYILMCFIYFTILLSLSCPSSSVSGTCFPASSFQDRYVISKLRAYLGLFLEEIKAVSNYQTLF
ncbi:pleiotropic drug resistance protein 2-like [Pyrus ussuriensis x Pyrus communis]|uniref:Pleiotropic drug resistance protein 2-like n=1 Tax=Pyrus ussuriensis x Pyrus communis TaxID=2448454 RepID=A0A5N5FX74_9ROSA|nr:pleiotropic drug resistance protein 2-like [Pyrus ussuriensis x Pyrus communis]